MGQPVGCQLGNGSGLDPLNRAGCGAGAGAGAAFGDMLGSSVAHVANKIAEAVRLFR